MGLVSSACSIETRVCPCNNNSEELKESNLCLKCEGQLDVVIEITNELSKSVERIALTLTILDIKYDMIIGLPSLVKHNLLFK